MLKTALAVVLVLVLIWPLSLFRLARANISSCSGSVSPSVLKTNTSATLNFSVTNSDSNAIVWVKISGPGGFEITGGSSGGWTANLLSASAVSFTGSSIAPSSSQNFNVNVTTGGSPTSGGFNIEVSDNGGGANAFSCGSQTVTVSNDTTPPVISNVVVSSITGSSATITWTTDEAANSKVNYGTSTSYGSSASDGGYVTSHSLNLTSLASGTTYHFQVVSADSVGNSSQTGDNTFTTAGSSPPAPSPSPTPTSTPAPNSGGGSSSGSSSSPPQSTPAPAPVVITDTTPATVTLYSDLSKPFKQLPVLSGMAADDQAVTRVDYSLDGGRNWLPARLSSPGAKQSLFSFGLGKLEDGNYSLRLRAFDPSSNVGYSGFYELIIDQIPPVVGPGLFSTGAQTIMPFGGRLYVLSGVEQRLTLPSIGGAVEMEAIASSSGQLSDLPRFPLRRNNETNLWSGALKFDKAGDYTLAAQAVDGAGNRVREVLGSLSVLKDGQVLSPEGKPLANAKVEVFYYDQTLQNFLSWDGSPFSQENPQVTDSAGLYKLVLPPGRYFLQISTPNLRLLRTNIFELKEVTPVNSDFKLEARNGFRLGPFNLAWFDLNQSTVEIDPASQLTRQNAVPNSIEKYQSITKLNLTDQGLDMAALDGRPTVISILNSWLPLAHDQLLELDKASSDSLRTVVILPLESAASARTLKKIGGYSLQIYADPQGKILRLLNLQFTPVHLFLDREGVVKKVSSGLLKARELLDNSS